MKKSLMKLTLLGALGFGIIGSSVATTYALDKSILNMSQEEREKILYEKHKEAASKLGIDESQLSDLFYKYHENIKNSITIEDIKIEKETFVEELVDISGKTYEEVKSIIGKNNKLKDNLTEEQIKIKKEEQILKISQILGIDYEELKEAMFINLENIRNAKTIEEIEVLKENFIQQLVVMSSKTTSNIS